MVQGKLVSFDSLGGYGFVRPMNGSEDVFIHVNDNDIDKRFFVEGKIFEFEVAEGERGSKAINAKVLNVDIGAGASESLGTHRIDDLTCEVYPKKRFESIVTELILNSSGSIPSGAVISLREKLSTFARSNGWID